MSQAMRTISQQRDTAYKVDRNAISMMHTLLFHCSLPGRAVITVLATNLSDRRSASRANLFRPAGNKRCHE